MNYTTFSRLTQLSQTLFGLPFLLAGALLPITLGGPFFSYKWLLILPAFLLARISGMAFNQLIDRDIDRDNPRTTDRVLPRGEANPNEVLLLAWGALIGFLVICYQINLLCLFLAPFVAALLVVYSFMKRVTAMCHFALGLIHFLSPVMASAALTGRVLPASICLGLVAFFIIAAGDILYAMQDYEFDRKRGLFSLPALVGLDQSKKIASWLHIGALFSLLGLGIMAKLSPFFFLVIPTCGWWLWRPRPFYLHNFGMALIVFLFLTGSLLWGGM